MTYGSGSLPSPTATEMFQSPLSASLAMSPTMLSGVSSFGADAYGSLPTSYGSGMGAFAGLGATLGADVGGSFAAPGSDDESEGSD